MTIDVNDAEPQREFGGLIPDGTFVRVWLHIEPGGYVWPQGEEADAGLFTESQSSDAIGLVVDLTVVWPEAFGGRRIFGDTFWTIAGGSVDASGISKGWKFTKTRIRAAINSCVGLDPKDESVKAKAMRQFASFSSLEGLEFFARLSVIPGNSAPNGGDYPDRNGLYHIVEPNEPEWALLQQRQEVPPQPVNLRPRGARSGSVGQASADPINPGWQHASGPSMGAAVAQAEAGWGARPASPLPAGSISTGAPMGSSQPPPATGNGGPGGGQTWVPRPPVMPAQQAPNASNAAVGAPVVPQGPDKPKWLQGI